MKKVVFLAEKPFFISKFVSFLPVCGGNKRFLTDIRMKETLKSLSESSENMSRYVTPKVTVVIMSPEGLLCQSGGVLGADHGGFTEDKGNPEDLW